MLVGTFPIDATPRRVAYKAPIKVPTQQREHILPYIEGEAMTKQQALTQFSSIIKKNANSVAFKFRQNADDLISAFYETTLKAGNFQVNSKDDFSRFCYRCMRNQAINVYRKNSKLDIQSLDFTNEIESEIVVVQPNSDLKEVATRIIDGIRTELKKHKDSTWVTLFEEVLLGQTQYHEVADMIGVPIGTVKTRIHVIRKLAEKRFGKLYKSLGLTAAVDA